MQHTSKNKKIDKLLDIESKLTPIDINKILEHDSLKVILSNDVIKILGNFEGPKFTTLGNTSKSTIGVLASKYLIGDENEDNLLPFLVGNVYRYYLKISKFRYIDMGRHKDEYLDYYKGKRILVRRIISRQDRLMATIVEEDFVNKKDLYSFKIINKDFLTEYILALLNSKLLSYLYIHTSTISTKDDFRQTTLAELRKLPIAIIDLKKQEIITESVRKLLYLNKNLYSIGRKYTEQEEKIRKEIEKVEDDLDKIVYDIYNLKKSEIEEIEGYFEKIKNS